jgi:hypothetical protein
MRATSVLLLLWLDRDGSFPCQCQSATLQRFFVGDREHAGTFDKCVIVGVPDIITARDWLKHCSPSCLFCTTLHTTLVYTMPGWGSGSWPAQGSSSTRPANFEFNPILAQAPRVHHMYPGIRVLTKYDMTPEALL